MAKARAKAVTPKAEAKIVGGLRKYETIVIYNPDLSDEALQAQITKVCDIVSSHGGAIERQEIIGNQQLAYPMQKRNFGIYVLFVVSAAPTFVSDFNRQMRISEDVVRSMVVVKDKFAPDYVRPSEDKRDLLRGDDLSLGEDEQLAV